MFIIPLAGTTLVVANVTGLIVAVLIFTKHRGKYYACIWSVMALVNGLVGALLMPYSMLGESWTTLPGIFFGLLGLFLWFNARYPTSPVRVDPYHGPRCVACREPIGRSFSLPKVWMDATSSRMIRLTSALAANKSAAANRRGAIHFVSLGIYSIIGFGAAALSAPGR